MIRSESKDIAELHKRFREDLALVGLLADAPSTVGTFYGGQVLVGGLTQLRDVVRCPSPSLQSTSRGRQMLVPELPK